MKKKVKYFINTVILPFILQLFVRVLYLLNKKVFHAPQQVPNEPILVAFWHGDLIMQPFTYKHIKKNGTIKTLISDHRDGETITKTVEYLGIDSIRGSSSKGGVKALLGAIKELKQGNDVAITPDGPRGPRHSVADGIVAIAQKSGAKIVIFNVIPTKYWQFNSWDKFTIPKPFGTIDFFISEPLDVSTLELQEAKDLIKNKMMIHTMKDEDEK
ncbi:lysophospholipid acyltransferase family protein [Arcobacter sp. FWKO B]|uniref:lysophospholipid acyltransferase family protein n=1 Tax=Arcobacter sp. FWKO B TaxID=2593672 RepID=UPI0018A5507F|nr:lysophospholipid acyltransferase family protein [Arcobacter sp. FWKO B]QOG12671.1 DUF374 domain-containing protein [Arcobacter sp. FWKO B]